MPISAGFAVEKITPELGMPIYRGAPIDAVLDDLYARAIAFEADGRKALVFSCDLLEVELAWSRALLRRIESETGVGGERVILACTHSHSAPAMVVQPDQAEDGPDGVVLKWRAFLEDRLVAAARAACEDLAPVVVKGGRAESRAGVNRRCVGPRRGLLPVRSDPDGEMDPTVTTLLFESPEGKRRAALVHYACHPVIYKTNAVEGKVAASRDFCGVVVDLLEEALACPVIFANGCCGDINPAVGCDDIREPELKQAACFRTGEMIADAALRALEGLTPIVIEGATKFGGATFDPQRAPWPDEAPERYGLDERLRRNLDILIGYWSPRERRDAQGRPCLPTEMRALRFGDLAFVGMPGEIFTRWGLLTKELSPAAWTLTLSNANDYVGYFPTEKAMAEGGSGTRIPMCVLEPEALRSFEESLRAVLASLGPG